MLIFVNFSTTGQIISTKTVAIRLFMNCLGSKKKVTTRLKMLINDRGKYDYLTHFCYNYFSKRGVN
jgi:hypothetical protein